MCLHFVADLGFCLHGIIKLNWFGSLLDKSTDLIAKYKTKQNQTSKHLDLKFVPNIIELLVYNWFILTLK